MIILYVYFIAFAFILLGLLISYNGMPQFLNSNSDFKLPDGVSYDHDKRKGLVSVYNLNLRLINNYKKNEIRVCDILNDKNNFSIYSNII